MANARTKMFLGLLPPVFAAMRASALATFPDPAAATAYSASIREEVVASLPELLEEFEKNAVARGAKVFWARDARQANEFILDLARKKGITYTTKGKSMVSEEMGLNDYLKNNGIEPFETDLGEFIAQQLNRPPFHLVGPAINVPPEEICELFIEKADMQEPTHDPVQLGYAARRYLRDKFHNLDMSITGINMAVAETGTIINVENEGNIRLNKSTPKTQVSIMSLEKVVPTMRDAMHLLRMLCRNCTGQKISAYVSFDSGPKKADEIDGPDELYIVIIDNGRSRIYQDLKTRQSLRCIRCGACMNNCPVYSTIGGYPYGWAYTGPMGQVLTPLMLGFDKTQDLYRACTLCGSCKSVCPGGIDHPGMFLYYRSKDVEGDQKFKAKKRDWKEERFFDLWSFGTTRSWAWKLGSKLVRPFLNIHAHHGIVSKIIGGYAFEGWFRNRDLPAFPEKTFHERWKDIQ